MPDALLLVGLILRAGGLYAAAWLADRLLRRRDVALRNAVWSVTLAAMLAMPLLTWLAPPLPTIRLPLSAKASRTASPRAAPLRVLSPVLVSTGDWLSNARARMRLVSPGWPMFLLGIYGLGAAIQVFRISLALRASRRIWFQSTPLARARANEWLDDVAAEQGVGYPLPQLRESPESFVPFTLGWSEPAILLPGDWREWNDFQLRSVLAHELAHVRRRDWARSVAAALNRALFWYLPPAWWLESRLADVAEEVCDAAAARSTGDVRQYADVIFGFARRVSLPARMSTCMARSSHVGSRIERLLATPVLSNGASPRLAWGMTIAIALPLVYAAAAFQVSAPAPATARSVEPVSARPGWGQVPGATLTSAEARVLEDGLVARPDDVEARTQLMGHYFSSSMPEKCAEQLFWLVEHHPDSSALDSYPSRTSSRIGIVFTNAAEIDRMAALWRRQALANPENPDVLRRAASFVGVSSPAEAATWFSHARAIAPRDEEILRGLAGTYAGQLYFLSPWPTPSGRPWDWTTERESVATRLVAELETSNDAQLLGAAGLQAALSFHPDFAPNPAAPASWLNYIAAHKKFWPPHITRLLGRALLLEPGNPRWVAALEHVRDLAGK